MTDMNVADLTAGTTMPGNTTPFSPFKKSCDKDQHSESQSSPQVSPHKEDAAAISCSSPTKPRSDSKSPERKVALSAKFQVEKIAESSLQELIPDPKSSTLKDFGSSLEREIVGRKSSRFVKKSSRFRITPMHRFARPSPQKGAADSRTSLQKGISASAAPSSPSKSTSGAVAYLLQDSCSLMSGTVQVGQLSLNEPTLAQTPHVTSSSLMPTIVISDYDAGQVLYDDAANGSADAYSGAKLPEVCVEDVDETRCSGQPTESSRPCATASPFNPQQMPLLLILARAAHKMTIAESEAGS